MRISRVFVDADLEVGKNIVLPDETGHYLKNVLRIKNGEQVIAFNGRGGEYLSVINITKKNIALNIKQFAPIDRESPLQINLGQAISHAEHFDIALQKATELGVHRIIPLLTARTQGVDIQRLDKKIIRWNNILRSACAQSGRNRVPVLEAPQHLEKWLENSFQGTPLFLEPTAEQTFSNLSKIEMPLTIVIGAEGGFTNDEIKLLKERNFIGIRLGSRILRTETAALAMIAACQARWGDWE